MGNAKPYNGHRSWNAWNVALWIGNDERLYRLAQYCVRTTSTRADAAALFRDSVGATHTPDGAPYNQTCVLEALRGLEE
jgi:hypothetical protein